MFLDFDDVICLNSPYGGYDVATTPWPHDLLRRLWHRPAMAVLESVIDCAHPEVVVTSSWLRIMQFDAIRALLHASDAPWLADALHKSGEALQASGNSRLDAVDAWLAANHRGEPYVVLDDTLSGTGLLGSVHDRRKRVVLCDVDVGLLPAHAPQLRCALSAPLDRPPA